MGTLRKQPLYPTTIEGVLIQSIFQVKVTEVNETIQLLFDYMEENHFLWDEAVQVCSDILEKIVNRFTSLVRKELQQAAHNFKGLSDVKLDFSYRLLRAQFEQMICDIMAQLDVKQTNSKDLLMERAEKYIQQYYQEQIKAHEVADFINITPNYFSTLFKQKTGKSFNEYVNQLRVEAAKRLLEETPFNINEIAEKVGYSEYKYFVDVFKKMTGYTPSHYRNLTSS
jgi:two-component system response regulator YesN